MNTVNVLCCVSLSTYTTTVEGSTINARMALALSGRPYPGDERHMPKSGAQLILNFVHGHTGGCSSPLVLEPVV